MLPQAVRVNQRTSVGLGHSIVRRWLAPCPQPQQRTHPAALPSSADAHTVLENMTARFASIRPRLISSIAASNAESLTPSLSAQRANTLVLKTANYPLKFSPIGRRPATSLAAQCKLLPL